MCIFILADRDLQYALKSGFNKESDRALVAAGGVWIKSKVCFIRFVYEI